MGRLFSFRLVLAGVAILSSLSCRNIHRVYFVPIGDAPLAEINLLIPHYRDRLGIVSRILPPVRLNASDFDTARKQLIAENVIDSMIRAYPAYAVDKSVVLIGITRQDMYPRSMDWRYCFGWRTAGNTAVVSTARMEWQDPSLASDPALLSKRLRKMVAKDLGVMYFGLSPNANPKSVLYDDILGNEPSFSAWGSKTWIKLPKTLNPRLRPKLAKARQRRCGEYLLKRTATPPLQD